MSASRWSATSWPPPARGCTPSTPPTGSSTRSRASASRRPSARSSAGSSSGCSRRRRPRSPRRSTGSMAAPPAPRWRASSSKGRFTPTSSSPAAAPAPPRSRATTTSADCRRHRVRAGRAAAGVVQGRGPQGRRPARAAAAIVGRQPFPGPGLGIRIIGEVTHDRLETLRAADAIAREELTAAGLDGQIWQCPVVLLADVRSVGVQGDGRTYGHPIVLRPVSSEDAMTADWTAALRRPRTHLHPDHQRGGRGQPRRPGRHLEAAGDDRVGVTSPGRLAEALRGGRFAVTAEIARRAGPTSRGCGRPPGCCATGWTRPTSPTTRAPTCGCPAGRQRRAARQGWSRSCR